MLHFWLFLQTYKNVPCNIIPKHYLYMQFFSCVYDYTALQITLGAANWTFIWWRPAVVFCPVFLKVFFDTCRRKKSCTKHWTACCQRQRYSTSRRAFEPWPDLNTFRWTLRNVMAFRWMDPAKALNQWFSNGVTQRYCKRYTNFVKCLHNEIWT